MKPRLLTLREVIQGIPERWRQQYGINMPGHEPVYPKMSLAVYDRLLQLDTRTCTPADLAAAGANWANLKCDACGEPCEAAALLGPAADDDERGPVTICRTCCAAALAMFPPHP